MQYIREVFKKSEKFHTPSKPPSCEKFGEE